MNDPPLDQEDMARLIARAYSEAKRLMPCDEIRTINENAAGCDISLCKRRAPPHYYDGKSINPRYVAEEILKDYKFLTVTESGGGGQGREVYMYVNGAYKPDAVSFLTQEIQRRLHANWKVPKANEIIRYIKDKTSVSYLEFDTNPNIINMLNGLYNRETKELLPHTPSYFSRRQLPIVYDEFAECPNTNEFYGQVLGDDAAFAVMQFLGYCTYPGMPIQRAFMLVGEPNSGKGTLLRQIEAFIGEANSCAVSLQRLEANAFATKILTEKMVNIYGDLAPTELPSVEQFRMMVGDDLVRAEYKGGKDFYFRNTCKFIYGANTTPVVRDQSDAYYRRWYLIPFWKRIEDCDIDIFLSQKLETPEELSGLFNRAMDGLEQLLEDGHFHKQPTVDESRDMYEKASDPIQHFIDDMIEHAYGEKLPKDDVYQAFKQYCVLHRLQSYGRDTFNRQFHDRGEKLGVEHIKKTDFGRDPETGRRIQGAGWLNIRFVKDEEDEPEILDFRGRG